jgi:hypothetical protein
LHLWAHTAFLNGLEGRNCWNGGRVRNLKKYSAMQMESKLFFCFLFFNFAEKYFSARRASHGAKIRRLIRFLFAVLRGPFRGGENLYHKNCHWDIAYERAQGYILVPCGRNGGQIIFHWPPESLFGNRCSGSSPPWTPLKFVLLGEAE